MLKKFFVLGMSLALIGLPDTGANANPAKVASVGNIERDVIIVRIATGQAERKDNSGEWLPLAIGADLSNNDVIKTGKNSTILLELPENAGFIRLLPETEIKVNQIKVDRTFEGGQIAELSVSKGKVVTKVRKFNRKSSRLQIHTKGATAAVRGTSFMTSYDEKNQTKVTVGDGKVAVKAEGEEVMVNPKEFTQVSLGSKPLTPSINSQAMELKIASIDAENGRLKITGTTESEAQINLNKVAVFPNNDGSFVGTMSLKEGANDVSVKAGTIDGRQNVSKMKVLKFTE